MLYVAMEIDPPDLDSPEACREMWLYVFTRRETAFQGRAQKLIDQRSNWETLRRELPAILSNGLSPENEQMDCQTRILFPANRTGF